MRKALFAVVLVSASFAGGAVVNGPGLRWAQTIVLSRLGIESEGDDGDNPGATSAANASAEEIPARPIPPLVIEPPGAAKARPGAVAHRAAAKAPDPEPAGPSPTRAASSTPSPSSTLPGLAPVPEGAPPLDPIPPLVVSGEPAREAPAPASVADQERAGDNDRGPAADTTVSRVSVTNPGVGGGGGGTTPTETGDWAEVRDSMRALGVSRYGVEGDPAGRVRFHCVIPVAGRRAVGQHFEAEGDDDLQAARAALKRVALWKATEAVGTAP